MIGVEWWGYFPVAWSFLAVGVGYIIGRRTEEVRALKRLTRELLASKEKSE